MNGTYRGKTEDGDVSKMKICPKGRRRYYCCFAAFALVTVLPALIFVAGYLWIWLGGPSPRCMKTFYAKMLRVLKSGDRWDWNVTHLKKLQVSIGTIPVREAQLKQLHENHNVRFIITLNEQWELDESSPVLRDGVEEKYFESLRLPTPDYTPPSLGDIRKAVSWTTEKLSQNPGARVFVHCNAGRGRSATLVLCLMIALKNMSLEEAYAALSSQRKISRMRGCCDTRRTNHWHAARRFERSHEEERSIEVA